MISDVKLRKATFLLATSITWTRTLELDLDPDLYPKPRPWTLDPKNLDPGPGPWKTWTPKNLDPEKPGII